MSATTEFSSAFYYLGFDTTVYFTKATPSPASATVAPSPAFFCSRQLLLQRFHHGIEPLILCAQRIHIHAHGRAQHLLDIVHGIGGALRLLIETNQHCKGGGRRGGVRRAGA